MLKTRNRKRDESEIGTTQDRNRGSSSWQG